MAAARYIVVLAAAAWAGPAGTESVVERGRIGGGGPGLEGLVPPDAAELLAAALGAPAGGAGSELSGAERRLLGGVSSALGRATERERGRFFEAVGAAPRPAPPRRPRAPGAEPRAAAQPTVPLRRERRRAQAAAPPPRCVTNIEDDPDDNLKPANSFEVIIEADEASDLNLLISHVAKIILEESMDFNVTLVPRGSTRHAIQRIADGSVHLNLDVGLEEKGDYDVYTRLVERDELVKDLGATGYSRTAGLFVANAHKLTDVEGQCLYPDFWETYQDADILGKLLSVHDVPAGVLQPNEDFGVSAVDAAIAPGAVKIDATANTVELLAADDAIAAGQTLRLVDAEGRTCAAAPKGVDLVVQSVGPVISGRDAGGDAVITFETDITSGDANADTNCRVSRDAALVCDRSEKRGWCDPSSGKYFSKACDQDGMSLRDPSKPCRAILGHYPSYEPAVIEQLVNNLGGGLELGMVWLGRTATEQIRQRAAAGEVFIFHHWHPSTLLQGGNFTWLDLPTHNRHEWLVNSSATPDGPIASAFAATAVLKLMKSDLTQLTSVAEGGEVVPFGKLLQEFVESFEMHEEQVDRLLNISWGIEKDYDCTGFDDTAECAEVHRRAACSWIMDNPKAWEIFLPAHKSCEPGQHVSANYTDYTTRCVPCELGRYMDRSSNQHKCKACPAGKYADGIGADSCKDCAAGKFSTVINSTTEASCIECEAGRYGPTPGRSECENCTAGEYQRSAGTTFCNPCNTGEYQPEINSVECIKCPVNERACSVEIGEDGTAQQKCLDKQADRSSCTCEVGFFRSVADSCEPNPAALSNITTSAMERCGAFTRDPKWGADEDANRELCLTSATLDGEDVPGGTNWKRFVPGSGMPFSLFRVTASETWVHGRPVPTCAYVPRGSCRPCPEGAQCCMCAEVAGCYDPAYGECNLPLLWENLKTCNATCCDHSKQGEIGLAPGQSPGGIESIVVAGGSQKGDRVANLKYQKMVLDLKLAGPDDSKTGVPQRSEWLPEEKLKLNGRDEGPMPSVPDPAHRPTDGRRHKAKASCWSGSPRPLAMQGHFKVEINNTVTPKDPVFLACNLRLPTTKLRTAVNWDYQSCWGGPDNTCACVDEDVDRGEYPLHDDFHDDATALEKKVEELTDVTGTACDDNDPESDDDADACDVRSWRSDDKYAIPYSKDEPDKTGSGIFWWTKSSPFDPRFDPHNRSKCESGNRGFLCASKCPTGYYRSFQEACKPCDDPEWSRSLWVGLFLGVFFLFIPVLFIGLYFSQSDKTANQYMVYPRMLVDLGVVFYLVYKSLFRYWPRELIGWQRTDGHSRTESVNSLFMECAFDWSFERRYQVYLLLPWVVVLGFSLCGLFVWFVYTYDNTLLMIDGGEDVEELTWKRMVLGLSSKERKEAMTAKARAEKGDATVVAKEAFQKWRDKAVKKAEEDEEDDKDGRFAEEEASRGNCLNAIARCLGRCLPNSATPRGSRIAIAPPKDNDGWDRFVNHFIQVTTFVLLLVYITMVNYSLTVFDCSTANYRWQLTDWSEAGGGEPEKLVGWGLPDWSARSYPTESETRADTSGAWATTSSLDLGYMEEEPTIACSWQDETWRRMALFGLAAFIGYTLMIPGTLVYVFWRNGESAKRGDMRYMQRYGFLLKPYKQHVYYWEIVNVIRKGFLSCIVRMTTGSPFMCATYTLTVLVLVIAHQARMQPYKYNKHNNCAIFVLMVAVIFFFSSLIFITEVATQFQMRTMLVINSVLALGGFLWAFLGFFKDFNHFMRLLIFTFKCEMVGRAEEEREDFWLNVDKPGLIRLAWYDPLVVRNRYSHLTSREERLPPGEPKVAPPDSEEKRGIVWVEGKPVVMKCLLEDQAQAHAHWVNFHEHFARFVNQIAEGKVDEKYLKELDDRDRDQQRQERELRESRLEASRSRSRSASATRSESPDSDSMAERADFRHLEACAMVLEELYSEKNLAFMILYMEYAIKHNLTKEFELTKMGPSDIAAHILQFARLFAEELVGGDMGEGGNLVTGVVGTALDTVTRAEAGGWTEDSSPRAAEGGLQSEFSAATTEGDPDDARSRSRSRSPGEDGVGLRESSMERRQRARDEVAERPEGGVESYRSDRIPKGLHRPHQFLGIDMKPFHRAADGAAALQREPAHAARSGTAMDFANPLHAMNFQLRDNAAAFNVGAIGGGDSPDADE